ncbi:MAG: FAD-binding protein [Candidatus Eisenbacteria bacterium]|nr:FAD-binding protein [Candidatus Eisenbacteria bacterium]
MYTPELLELIKRVEATRGKRLDEKFPLLSPEAKQELLEGFHPDYKDEVFRTLKIGPSKGERTPVEYADVLEAYSALDPDAFRVGEPDYDVDVLVVGGGGAGAAAALVAQEKGANVLIATKLRLGDSNTVMAQGGIQGADKANDSPATHYLDVMGGGHYKNDPELVRALVMDAPDVLSWLEKLGVMFDKEKDGTMITIHGGGTSRKRMHAARDYTGGEIMKTLKDEIVNRDIPLVEYAAVYELLTDGGKVTGAILYNMETEHYLIVKAKTVILATGGGGRLHVMGFPTSNHYGATGDGLVLGYRAGAPLVYMNTIQYHPTGAAYPEQILGLLVTEKVRSIGGQITNIEGDRFVYELETRDVEAAAIIRECEGRKKGVVTPSGQPAVWLDTPVIEAKLGQGACKARIPAMYRQYERFGIDMAKHPILIYPTQHYQNGGLKINDKCETDVPNLYAAGEVSGGVHGTNRLMGNSLLDVVVFGRRAGAAAAGRAKASKGGGKLTLAHLKSFHAELKSAGIEREHSSPMLLPEYRRPETTEKTIGVL